MKSLLPLTLTLVLPLSAVADTLQTNDGQTFTGAIRLDGKGDFLVTAADGSTNSVELSKTIKVNFDRAKKTDADSGEEDVLPPLWQEHDYGNISRKGGSAKEGGVVRVFGSGFDINGGEDSFHFLYYPLYGDGQIVARLISTPKTNDWGKVAIMIRENYSLYARFAMTTFTVAQGVNFQRRVKFREGCTATDPRKVSLPVWLKLERKGTEFTSLFSVNGQKWETLGTEKIPFPTLALVGLAVCARNDSTLCMATFDNVEVTVHGVKGDYFDGAEQKVPKLMRHDLEVNFGWENEAPDPSLKPNNFSAVWTGQIEPRHSESYFFHVESEGTTRLWVNQQLVDQHGGKAEESKHDVPMPLKAGQKYDFKLEFLKTAANAPATTRLWWSSPSQPKEIIPNSRLSLPPEARFLPLKPPSLSYGKGLAATYFSNPDLSGSEIKRTDRTLNFDWSGRSPIDGIGNDNFSVRWSGQIEAQFSEAYNLHLLTDDGARLWLNDKLLIDHWQGQNATEYTTPVPMMAGVKYNLRIEYFQNNSNSVAKLFWSSPSTPKQIIPTKQLYPTPPPPPVPIVPESPSLFPRGVMLTSGSFLAGSVRFADDSHLEIFSVHEGRSLPLAAVARIYFRPLTQAMADHLLVTRKGLLLASGDFLDSEVKSIENGRVTMNSVLFGLRAFFTNAEAGALVFRNVKPAPTTYQVRLLGDSVLLAKSLALEADTLVVEEPVAGRLKIPAADVLEIKRTSNAPSR